jgi:hypothetical protein
LTAQHFPPDLQEKMALGDPGVLANVLLDAPVRKKYSIGVIPHYKDIRHPAVTGLVNLGDDVRLIPVSWTPEEVVREVAACEVVLSSSLHGMIVADALGVPNAHLRLNESVGGVVKGRVHGLFKYRDYYSAYEIPRRYEPRYARDIFGVPRAELVSMVDETWDPPHGIDALREGLVASLPY